MNIERPGSPSVTILAPASKRRSTSIEARRSRLASDRPPKQVVARKNAFRSGELTAIDPIYSRSRQRQVRNLFSLPRGCGHLAMDRYSAYGGGAADPSQLGIVSARDIAPLGAGPLFERNQPRLVVGLVDHFRRQHHFFRQRLLLEVTYRCPC